MPFVKGQIANPNGRPKESPILTPLVRQYMELSNAELNEESKRDDLMQKEHIAIAIVREIKKGSSRQLATVWDRTDGKVKEQVDVTSGGQPIPIIAINALQRDISDKEDTITD